ncbi:D-2-hydroxyacid dehydrogenase family protein [Streptomyces albus subsp. chlorinus]|uniref:D-2-hydroxyacid dehydrogenase family protein n=1 Tax=Streptomyces albus TaxID=1888 RepID=UPI00157046B6|nr:D-2-hydroxyacid dehydrogenase family protein [Streptomyces albus]NSC23492.1 D-2-hydroxyacid dehydrogenase family protein [Streptomyces albus subsp. chlorinus]
MTRLRCALVDDFQGVGTAMADWSRVAEEVEVVGLREHPADEDALVAMLDGFDIAVTLRERVPFPRSVLARLPRLRLLIASGMRNTVIDYAAAEEHGVTVCGTASSPVPPLEHTWALLLGLARGIGVESAALREGGPWQQTVGADLHGKRLGLLGLGKIGGRMAPIAAAFGMEVLAWSQNLTRERADEVGAVRAGSLHELLAASDFVSVHLALSERTRHLIGAKELAAMKPDAFLINTSRAAIVDQDALLDALREGTIAGAALDVFDIEPLPAGHPLRTAPRLLATPHLGYVTRDNYRRYYGDAVENIRAYLDGSPVRRLP